MNNSTWAMPQTARGFTLIELMIVIAIIGIMATMAVPSFQDRIIRTQVSEGIALADFAKRAVADYYSKTNTLPADNAAAGLPPANRIVGNYVVSVTVREGALDIAYGQQANRNLLNKVLTLRPAVVEGYPQVPIAWVCGSAAVPTSMKAMGDNATNLPNPFLPLDCRNLGGAPK
jgi:type IV pilus assembly protein PilA